MDGGAEVVMIREVGAKRTVIAITIHQFFFLDSSSILRRKSLGLG
jgi:hypothetical protein